MVSVKTETPVAKDRMMEVMAALRNTSVNAPVAIGDEVLADVCGSRIIITKAVD
jgi:CxxC motif-containing protein